MSTSTQQELVVAYRPGPKWLVDVLYFFSLSGMLLLLVRMGLLILRQDFFDLLLTSTLVILPVLLFRAANKLQQGNIVLRKEGISFPAHMALPLRFKLTRKWNDVGAVALLVDEEQLTSVDEDEKRWMVFHFGSGGNARILLNELSIHGLDTMFKASKRWGSTAVMAPELIELRRKLLSGPTLPGLSMSLTHLWEEELKSRFTATNFVPLAQGSTLQNKRIRIISQIGAGGHSAIYLAQLGDGKKIVLKEMVVPSKAEDTLLGKAKEMFKREGSILIKLKHPQIARVFDHFQEEGRDYLVLEYIPGQSLRQLVLVDGPQPEERVIDWAHTITTILQFLHSQNPPVIHRDLTPDNIVLGSDGKLYIIDFGAANEFVGTATGTLIGKQAYIAPEQFRGRASLASDLYSLGGTLFFLLTGAEPEPLAVSHPSRINSSVSTQMDEFVRTLTELEVSDRLKNCGEVLTRIADLRHTERSAVLKFGGGN